MNQAAATSTDSASVPVAPQAAGPGRTWAIAPGLSARLYSRVELAPLQTAYQAGGGAGEIGELAPAVMLLREVGCELPRPWARLDDLRLESRGVLWALRVRHRVGWELDAVPGVALLQAVAGDDRAQGGPSAAAVVLQVPAAWDEVLGGTGSSPA